MRVTTSMAVRSEAARRAPPAIARGPLRWLSTNLFSSVNSTLLTVLIIVALVLILPGLFGWAVTDAVFYSADGSACRQAKGACWAVVAEKHRVILFGTYPYEEHWRGWLVIMLVVALAVASSFRRLWSVRLFLAWLVTMATVFALMFGGFLGLRPIGTHEWGGLPLTLLLFLGTISFGLPLAIVLALGRRSHLPVVRGLSVGTIELVRGVPLLAVLFMASVMFPLFVPEKFDVDKLLRAQIGMIIFFAAYAAEIVRGGLQAIPRGQHEAADAIGLSYWQATRRIVLPQALRIVIPALMNDVVRAFKNTTFVSIIGLFDMLGATKAALQDLRWIRYSTEAYIFIFFLYFAFCLAMSRYSERIERDLKRGRNY